MSSIPEQTIQIIEKLLLDYNENNNSYTEVGIDVNDLSKLLVRTEYLDPKTSETLTFEEIFYDDVKVFNDMSSIKEQLMEWYRGNYIHHVALFDNISDSGMHILKFVIRPRYLKSGDTSKFMLGFKSSISDMTDFITYMSQLKDSNRIDKTVTLKRYIIGVNDYIESFPMLKQLSIRAKKYTELFKYVST